MTTDLKKLKFETVQESPEWNLHMESFPSQEGIRLSESSTPLVGHKGEHNPKDFL